MRTIIIICISFYYFKASPSRNTQPNKVNCNVSDPISLTYNISNSNILKIVTTIIGSKDEHIYHLTWTTFMVLIIGFNKNELNYNTEMVSLAAVLYYSFRIHLGSSSSLSYKHSRC